MNLWQKHPEVKRVDVAIPMMGAALLETLETVRDLEQQPGSRDLVEGIQDQLKVLKAKPTVEGTQDLFLFVKSSKAHLAGNLLEAYANGQLWKERLDLVETHGVGFVSEENHLVFERASETGNHFSGTWDGYPVSVTVREGDLAEARWSTPEGDTRYGDGTLEHPDDISPNTFVNHLNLWKGVTFLTTPTETLQEGSMAFASIVMGTRGLEVQEEKPEEPQTDDIILLEARSPYRSLRLPIHRKPIPLQQRRKNRKAYLQNRHKKRRKAALYRKTPNGRKAAEMAKKRRGMRETGGEAYLFETAIPISSLITRALIDAKEARLNGLESSYRTAMDFLETHLPEMTRMLRDVPYALGQARAGEAGLLECIGDRFSQIVLDEASHEDTELLEDLNKACKGDGNTQDLYDIENLDWDALDRKTMIYLLGEDFVKDHIDEAEQGHGYGETTKELAQGAGKRATPLPEDSDNPAPEPRAQKGTLHESAEPAPDQPEPSAEAPIEAAPDQPVEPAPQPVEPTGDKSTESVEADRFVRRKRLFP